MVKTKKIKDKLTQNRFRRFRYAEPLSEAPSKLLDPIEKLLDKLPKIKQFEEFEKKINIINTVLGDIKVIAGVDECNIYIEFEAGISILYSVNYRYYKRKQKCRLKDKNPIERKEYVDESDLLDLYGTNGKVLYVVHYPYRYEYDRYGIAHNTDAAGYFYQIINSVVLEVDFPENEFEMVRGKKKEVYARIKVANTYATDMNRAYSNSYGNNYEEINSFNGTYIDESTLYWFDKYSNFDGGFITYNYSQYKKSAEIRGYSFRIEANRGKIDGIQYVLVASDENYINGFTQTPEEVVVSQYVDSKTDNLGFLYHGYFLNIDLNIWNREVKVEHSIYTNESTNKKSPPPPRRMKCCPDNSELLKRIYQIVKQNKEAIGVDDLPANLPATLIKTTETDAGQVNKPNLVQLLGWYFERFDEVMGQFQLEIDVDDIDAVTEGNQKYELRLPNIAETLSEMVMMLTTIMYNSDLGVNLTTRAMIEAGQTKQTAYKNHELIDTIVDFLGYQVGYKNEKIPMSFTPGTDTFELMVKEKEIQVSVAEMTDKRTFPAMMQELLHAAAIIRAVHWQKIDPNKDIASQLKSMIEKDNKIKDAISKNGSTEDTD
ncbi:MAG: hypothetical protein IGS23_14075 [Rivularia sp. T60_A2020_040]|nr:hypothetical protein [Rivularia sp. T60_A2020_040]